MIASLCCFNPFLPVEAMRCTHLSFAVRRTSLPSITTMARRMLNGVALHQICVPAHWKPLYHIPRNFYPSGGSSIAVTTSDFPNQLYLLLQRNRKQIQDKEQGQQVVEVDLKKRNIPLILLVCSSDTKNDCVID